MLLFNHNQLPHQPPWLDQSNATMNLGCDTGGQILFYWVCGGLCGLFFGGRAWFCSPLLKFKLAQGSPSCAKFWLLGHSGLISPQPWHLYYIQGLDFPLLPILALIVVILVVAGLSIIIVISSPIGPTGVARVVTTCIATPYLGSIGIGHHYI